MIHQEHIVVIDRHVGDIRRDTKSAEDRECNGNVFLLHAYHSREGYVKRCKAGMIFGGNGAIYGTGKNRTGSAGLYVLPGRR